ncbi:SPOR domain-containing protein [Ramlibacter sp. WS9]|uniref:SPOR domain-containing protein n=1 Tax=Ramlibacter sp. WS9 TaxID=1882741 RepID=UPI001142D977|nr:SPOR domain-containing protein [Ramlibacter sp. WS9]ROZ61999.1 SPOR domain-containing protein [Ramlibacter sp. WS9]
MKNSQRGSVIVGIIIGVVLGLAAALAVAVYVTKVPVPFLNKGQSRTAEQDAAEVRKNRDWDPNAPLYGKNPAKPLPPAPSGIAPAPPVATIPAPPVATAPAASVPKAIVKTPAADPLGELASARTSGPGADPFFYFVQAGAFRTPEDAEAQRAKLSLMGIEAKVTEREQSGRQVFRVRVGPFDKKEEADRQKEKLESGGVETALVRVQR